MCSTAVTKDDAVAELSRCQKTLCKGKYEITPTSNEVGEVTGYSDSASHGYSTNTNFTRIENLCLASFLYFLVDTDYLSTVVL